MNFFKIPKEKLSGPSKIIGIIDASGSMGPHWPWLAKFWNEYIPADNALTICFDTITKIAPGNKLDENINKHGGGGTNITAAFNVLEKEMENIPKETPLTVIFISDGQDSNLNALERKFKELKGNYNRRRLNFICLGIGSSFPTFLSMRLREKYHKGDETLPAIFLIEYPSEKAFLNKFESIKPYFSYNNERIIKPPVLILPWREYSNKVYESGWVMTDSDKVELDGVEIDISKNRYNIEGVVEIFRSWTQMIHLDSLQTSEDVKDRALKTLAIMEEIIKEVKEAKGIDLLNLGALNEKQGESISFGQRAMNNYLKHTAVRAAWFYEDIKLLANGKSAKELNEFDAAKRIGIGTIVGKYHQKAFALKGITVDDFQVIRDDFKEIYANTKLNPKSNQEASVITLQNQKEIFLQEDFLKGLELCKSQFDLVEAFPVIGLAIKIKRFDGSRLNPWMTSVRFIAKHNKAIDSISILQAQNSLQLKVGEDKIETINAVLPLFDKEDADLQPLISSKLFHLLMTFNVVQNIDTLYEEAYLTLLANTLLYLFEQPESEWRDNLFAMIHSTCQITYSQEESFLQYRAGLLNDPPLAITKDHDQLKFGSIDLSKAILHLFMIRQEKKSNEEKIEQILQAIIQRFVQKIMKDKDTKLESYLKVKSKGTSLENVKNITRKNFHKFQTKGDFRRGVLEAFEVEASNPDQYEFDWDISPLEKIEDKLNLNVMQGLSKAMINRVPTKEEWIKYIVLGYSCSDLVDCFANKDTNVHDLTGKLGKKLTVDVQKGGVQRLPQTQEVIKALEPEFEHYFRELHWEILPISETDLKKHCEKTGTSYQKYQWLAGSGLLRNACLAPKCPFYLKINDHLGHHLAIWDKKLPVGFHRTVKKYIHLSNEEIYQKFANGECSRNGSFKFAPENFDVTKEQTMSYIQMVKDSLKHNSTPTSK